MLKQHKLDTLSAINQYKDEEKKKAFIATKFKILQNKKAMAELSSHDMLLLAEALESEKSYSTTRMKNQLRSFAMLRAEKVIKKERVADENFADLVKLYGNNRQKNFVSIHFPFQPKQLLKQPSVSLENISSEKPQTKKEPILSKGWFKKICKKARKTVIVVGITMISLVSGKFLFNNFNNDPSGKTPKKDNKETTFSPNQNALVTPIEEQAVMHETINNIMEKQDTVAYLTSNLTDNLNKAYKDRFDSALEILLGAEKRDLLYKQIDKLAENGKIEYKNGTTREWYAHAFTMYAKVSPNSDNNKLISGLLAGDEVDKTSIHDLVIKAKRNGTGISGFGTYSAFDNAPQKLQKQHIQNRKNVTTLEKMVYKSR